MELPERVQLVKNKMVIFGLRGNAIHFNAGCRIQRIAESMKLVSPIAETRLC
jgi:hypothetical protein